MWYFSCASFPVQTLRIALFRYLDGNIDKDFDKGNSIIPALAAGTVQFAGSLSIRSIRRDKGRESYC